ncbi:gamma-glutamyltransferase [Neisseria sp.]|uniref:gamma-glutamyltransferase n=1 Tax=Neisseria sp. TaxID=192066 RepID=UPI0035A1115A
MKTPFIYSILTVCILAACAKTEPQFQTASGQTPAAPAAAPTDSQNHAPEQGTGLTEQKLVHARRFIAASANPLATEAGYEILKKGGGAVDAMVAMQTVLSLTEPQSSGLGGGAFVVYWDNKAKKLTTFDARETAPETAKPELFLDGSGKPLEFMDAVVGGRSVGIPGVPKLMEQMHRRYGKLPWKTLFAKPVDLAERGFAVSPRMAKSVEQNQKYLARYPQTAAYFLPGGKPLAAGTVLKNPEFAASVKLLAAKGSAPFYTGKPAENIVDAVNRATGVKTMSMADFKNYRVVERKPVCTPYRGYEVCGMGAPSSGGIALGQILGIMQRKDIGALGADNIESWRWLGEASRAAFADRDYYVADPAFAAVPTAALLDKGYLAKRAAAVGGSGKAAATVAAGRLKKGAGKGSGMELPSTSHIAVVDKAGNVLSMTTSIENAFGSTLTANGYLLNNELTDFAFNPVDKDGNAVANSVAGGKRPRSSMAPTIVMKNGRPYLAVGSPGGSRIIGYVAKTLVAHIDWGMDIQQAIALPNMLNRGSAYELEENTAAAAKAGALEQLGYKVQVRDLNSGVQGIVIGKDGLQGGADPRREGKVMGD